MGGRTAPEPRDAPQGDSASWWWAFGCSVGSATLASALATVPAALRLHGRLVACSSLGAWSVLIAVSIVPVGLAVALLRRARSGLAILARDSETDGGGAPFRPELLAPWLASVFLALLALGAVLRKRTHHHALAGVVFAIAAPLIAGVLALLVHRLSKLGQAVPPWVRWSVLALAAAAAGALLAFVRARGGGHPGASVLPDGETARLIDIMALALSALLASSDWLASRRVLGLLGPPAAAALFVLGASSLSSCPSLGESLDEHAPVFAWILALWGRR